MSLTTPAEDSPGQARVGATTLILLAIAIGLCAGYLDLTIMIFKKYCWNNEGYIRNASDFPWTVPLAHAVLLSFVAVLVIAMNWVRPKGVSLRAAAWLYGTVAIWGALVRMPVYVESSLILSVGLGRAMSGAIAAQGAHVRRLARTVAALLGVLAGCALLSSGLQSLVELRAVAALSPPPPAARNVVLIVWDTVRAYNLSLHGYPRKTTPNLVRWAQRGVKYDQAIAPAPWTYPSHSSFFTGQWPYQLNTQWRFVLDDPSPTLAEHLAVKGYQTAGFSANTNCCSYEGGLARGFAHFEDYALSPQLLLARTVPGKTILESIARLVGLCDIKWLSLQSRPASEINRAFLNWLDQRRSDRPFFAFLNYFDAHEPYLPPAQYLGRFGIMPSSASDYHFLLDYVGLHKDPKRSRDVLMARDCYDDCIAYLDEQLGQLLETLRGRGLLDNTVVIITSDHGEAFGDHGTSGHSYSVFLDELCVPLVILAPGAPEGRVVKGPVSLRDLPATVVDLLGLASESPFPGRSLAALWRPPLGRSADVTTSPAFSEQFDPSARQSHAACGPGDREFQMSLVDGTQHYIRNAFGVEKLFNLTTDPYEQLDLMNSPYGKEQAEVFRLKLLGLLDAGPATTEVERAYLGRFRQALRADILNTSTRRVGDGS
jgi:arylsulfatase A-like enzyme